MASTFAVWASGILLLAVTAYPRQPRKPNFTGTWKADLKSSTLEIPLPESVVARIDHREPEFRISRTFVFDGKKDTFGIDLTTDRKEIARREPSREIRARAYWEGDRLVFDAKVSTPGEEASNVVKYSLSKDRRTFVAEERYQSPKRSYQNRWVFEKQ